MKIGPRGKLLALVGLFLVPIVASFLAYRFADVHPTANYGELILPPGVPPAATFAGRDGRPFAFADFAGHWIIVTADAGACDKRCLEKLVIVRQVRLGLGRNAPRVERVFVADDGRMPSAEALMPFPGMQVAVAPTGAALPSGMANDRAHIYLVDPNGNVMMRWPASPDPRRMLKDLERLLKASQIG